MSRIRESGLSAPIPEIRGSTHLRGIQPKMQKRPPVTGGRFAFRDYVELFQAVAYLAQLTTHGRESSHTQSKQDQRAATIGDRNTNHRTPLFEASVGSV